MENALNTNKTTELDDLILTGFSKKLLNVRINQLEKKIIVLSVKGKDYVDNFNEALDKLKHFSNHLKESDTFINELIINAQN